MRERPAKDMSDDDLCAELVTLDVKWKRLRADLEESGGASGSPGEWLVKRMGEIETELQRRERVLAKLT